MNALENELLHTMLVNDGIAVGIILTAIAVLAIVAIWDGVPDQIEPPDWWKPGY